MALILLAEHAPFIPIARLLAKEGHKFAGLGNFAQTLVDLDLPARPLADATAGLQDAAFIEAGRVFNAALSIPFEQNGLNPGPLKFITGKMPAFLFPRLSDLAMLVLALDVARPDLCVLQNDVVPMNRAVALWGRARSVPVLHVPHAVYQDVNRGPAGTDVHDLVTASHLVVGGWFQKRWYEARGEGENQTPNPKPQTLTIRETGLPQFDLLLEGLNRIDRRRARRLLRLDPNRPTVGYFSTWPQHTNASGVNDEWQVCYLEFLKAMKELQGRGGVQVIVKCHPGGGQENWQWHAEMAKQMEVACALTPAHLEVCLKASDLWFAYGGSNTILDAAHVSGLRLMSTHGYEGDAAVYRSPMDAEGIAEAVAGALMRPAPVTVGFLAKYVGNPDGLASERIAMWCGELLQGKKRLNLIV